MANFKNTLDKLIFRDVPEKERNVEKNNTSSDSNSQSKKYSLNNFWNNSKENVIDLLKTTKVEIYALATLGALTAGIWSYSHESAQDHCLRLAFSEKSQIELQAKLIGADVPHLTDFLTSANDYYMKIFESSNESWGDYLLVKDNTTSFAKTLEYRIEPTFKRHHYELPQLAQRLPLVADSTLKDLAYLRKMQKKVNISKDLFEKTWDDSHDDVTHTEVYTTEDCSTDSDGNTTCTTQIHTREVYDYTDNTYVYHKKFGEQASVMLDNIIKEFPNVVTNNLFMPAVATGAENEYVIEKSRKSDLKDKKLTPEQYLVLANNWIFASRQFTDLKNAHDLRDNLENYSNVWRQNKNTAKSDEIRTYNYSHAEPLEFITCDNIISNSANLSNVIDKTLGSIEFTKARIPRIEGMIIQYIDLALMQRRDDREVRNLKNEIISQAMDGYTELFPNGLPLKHSKMWHVPLIGLLGLIIGAAAGTGWDYINERRYNNNRFNPNHKSYDLF